MKRKKHPLATDISNFVSYYSNGLSTREIERKTGFSHTTVRKYLVISGVTLRNRSQSQKGKPRPRIRKPLAQKLCPICNTSIYAKPGRLKRRVYCSRKCNGAAQGAKQETLPRPTLICEHCKNSYKPKQVYEAKTRRFCSPECSRAWNAINITGNTKIELVVQSWLDNMKISYETQFPISKFFADIFLTKYKIVIECDGDYWHSLPGAADRDRMRNIIMRRMGYCVIRLSENKIKNKPDKCKRTITDKIKWCCDKTDTLSSL